VVVFDTKDTKMAKDSAASADLKERKSRWSPDHWFLNTNKPAPLDWALLKLAAAAAMPRPYQAGAVA
jgi:hypothetical protein